MSQLPEGFFHVGDGRLSVSEKLLNRIKTSQDIQDVYEIQASWIAKGMYGIVRSALSKQSGVSYAAKFLRRRRRGQCCLNEINHEVAVLMLCADSNHVVKLQAVHETGSEIALILELASGGELQTLIDDQGHLSEQKTRVCMREILRALQHMHTKSIAHLDLKPQNILLVGKDVEDGLKLCDFGIARFIDDKSKLYDIIGTPDYVAPEVLHYDPLSLQTDVWSIGVVAYVLLSGLSPFGADTKQETFLNVTKCSLTFPDDLFKGISSDAIDFIKSTLRIKPRERLTVDKCLEHRWLQDESVCRTGEILAGQLIHEPILAVTCKLAGNLNDAVSCTEEQNIESKNYIQSECHQAARLIIEEKVHYGMLLDNKQCSADAPEEMSPDRLKCAGRDSDAEEFKARTGSLLADDDIEQVLKPVGGVAPLCVNASKTVEGVIVTDDNKENVMVAGNAVSGASAGTCSLFPDAPTTPKVSRKALPTEQLSDHHIHHANHNGKNGHHYAHHIHHHHHHLHSIHTGAINHTSILHHYQNHSPCNLNGYNTNQQNNVCYVGPNPQSTGIFAAATGSSSAARSSSSSSSCVAGNATAVQHTNARQNAPPGVKSFVHMMQSHQQQQQHQSAVTHANSGISWKASPTLASSATSCTTVSATGGDTRCTANALVVITTAPSIAERLEPNETSCIVSDTAVISSSSCRATVTTTAALCGLKCNESSVGSIANTGNLASPGPRTLQQCDNDVITC